MRHILFAVLALAAMATAGCVREDLSENSNFDKVVDYEDYREPAELTFVVTTSGLNAHFENDSPSTRSESSPFGRWIREQKLSDSHPTRWDVDENSWDKLDGGVRNPSNATTVETTTQRTARHDTHDANADNELIKSLAFFLVDMQRNADGSRPKRWGRIVAYRLFLPEADYTSTDADGTTTTTSRKYFFRDADNITGYDLPTIWLDGTSGGHAYKDDFQLDPDGQGGFNGYALMDDAGNLIEDAAAANGGYPGYPVADTEGKMMEKGSKAMVLTFKYDSPLHKTSNDLEKLRRGDIWALAITNFHEVSTTYKGHPIGWYIKEVIDYWHRHEKHVDTDTGNTGEETHGGFHGIPANYQSSVLDPGHEYTLYNADPTTGAATPQTYQGFMGFRYFADAALRQNDSDIESHTAAGVVGYDDDYTNDRLGRIKTDPTQPMASLLRHRQPTILASNDWIGALIPGQNVHKLSLLRLTSRITFTIANHSRENLTVEDFELSPTFAQAAAWVFPHDKTPYQSAMKGNYFTSWQDAPDVMSDKAMVPFRVRTYPTMNTPEVFFEGLTYESGPQVGATPEQMWFKIKVSYDKLSPAPDQLTTTNANDFMTLTNLTDALASSSWAKGSRRYFVMENYRNAGYYIHPDDTNTYGITATNSVDLSQLQTQIGNNNFDYVWALEKVSATKVKIWHPTRGYLVTPVAATVELGTACKFTFDTAHENAGVFEIGNNNSSAAANTVSFTTTSGGNAAYLHGTNTNPRSIICLRGTNYLHETASHFRLYEVSSHASEKIIEKLTKHPTVPISVFDRATGMAEDLTEIKRNDHIRVEVAVSYEPDEQKIEFEVRDWKTSNNEATFN